MERAHVFRHGEIGFRPAHRKLPRETLPLPDVPRETIEARARRAPDGRLFVPGVAEAATGMAAVDALIAFCNRLTEAAR